MLQKYFITNQNVKVWAFNVNALFKFNTHALKMKIFVHENKYPDDFAGPLATKHTPYPLKKK